MTERQSAPIRAAMLYESEEFREPLRAALAAAGASVAGELRISEFEPASLRDLDCAVLVVNLEPILNSRPELMQALVDGVFPGAIVFNDAEATSSLAGADKARWARHLASKIIGGTGLPPPPHLEPEPDSAPPSVEGPRDEAEVWILGASIGGPEAVRAFLSSLGEGLPFSFILAQHIGAEFLDLMVTQLNQVTQLSVRCAVDGDELRPGQMLVVPVDQKLTVNQQMRIQLEPLTTAVPYSPCIDQVLIDAADRFGAGVNAIIFSGMANDGVAGAAHMMERGGEVWVQDPETCVVGSMVNGALKTGGVKVIDSPSRLAERLNERAARFSAAGN